MEVSIIIPVFNCLELTRACLASLEHTVPWRYSHEVILIDDGSTDGSREWFATLPASRYRVVLNERRRGYAHNNNLGAELARGDVLCLLNNDTVLLDGWLSEMLRVLEADPMAGFVGNIQREPVSGLIDHRGVVFNPRGNPIHVGKDTPVPPEEPAVRWPAVTAACCVIRRELFLEMGGFDERFQNGFEDVDLCLRLGSRGYRHHVANRSVIYHHISAAPGRHARHRENLRLYRRLWGWRLIAWRHRDRFLERKANKPTDPERRAARAELLRSLREQELEQAVQRQREAAKRGRESAAQWSERTRRAWENAWEARREERRQYRQDLVDARADGWRYLGKHWFRPWRYNVRRVWRALEQTLHPLPELLPPPPTHYHFSPPGPANGIGAANANGTHAGSTVSSSTGMIPGGFLLFEPAEF